MTFNVSYIHPNLALRWLYVARPQGFDVIIKEFTLKDSLDRVIKSIEEINPDIIGMSIYIWNSEISKKLIRTINQNNKYRILIGGPEVSFEAEKWLDENIEGVLRGEGEKSFWEACQGLKADGLLSRDYASEVSYAISDITWLETLESPYFLAMDDEKRAYRYLYFESSRGCPYRCAYCLSSLDYRVRNFSLEYIKKELKKLETHPCKQVKFLDRTFNSHPQRALSIAEYINNLQVDFSFQFEVTLEHFPQELLNFFCQVPSGKFRFEVGVQSFNNDTLRAIDRIQDARKLSQNIKLFQKHHQIMHTDLIAGLPYEDYVSFKNSFFKLFALHSDEIQMGILKLLKGTKLKKEAAKYGIVYNPLPPYEVIKTSWIDEKQMDRIKIVARVIDKVYNTYLLRNSINTLFDQHYDIFEIMADYGSTLFKMEKIQVSDYFLKFYEVLKKAGFPLAQELLLNDYYRKFNEKPKALFKRPDNELRKALYQKLIDEGYDQHILNEYSVFDYAYIDGKKGYQLVTYGKNHQCLAVSYFHDDFTPANQEKFFDLR